MELKPLAELTGHMRLGALIKEVAPLLIFSLFPSSGQTQIVESVPASHFPLQVGNSWKYHVEVGDQVDTQTNTIIVKTKISGHEFFVFDKFLCGTKLGSCDPVGFRIDKHSGEILRYDFQDSKQIPFFDFEFLVYEGCETMWYIEDRLFLVPAGLFAVQWYSLECTPTETGFDFYVAENLGVVFTCTHYLGGCWVEFSLLEATINDIKTDVEDTESGLLPREPVLFQNHPNPFNNSTTISFKTSATSLITIKIFDLLGRTIVAYDPQKLSAGLHSIKWDGKDNHGNAVASGIYFYRLETQEFTQTKKMTLLK